MFVTTLCWHTDSCSTMFSLLSAAFSSVRSFGFLWLRLVVELNGSVWDGRLCAAACLDLFMQTARLTSAAASPANPSSSC